MSTGYYRLCFHILWITLQILVFAYPDSRSVMANAKFTPYVSEFEYASRFHPSKNPECPNGFFGNSGKSEGSKNRRNFESSKYRRSPEEGSPVGQEPSIEVRAILVRCPKTEEETEDILINRNVYNITAGRSQDILDFHGVDRDEPMHHSEVRDCRRKLTITMKFNNIGRTKTQEEFVVIDHVLDPVTMHKARLLNPFVVKVRQEPVLQLYGLKFQGVVNAEAREEVISNKQSNYTGCDDSSENPTCGQMIFEDKPIPYSQGFCCSCDPEVNVERQATILNETVVSSLPSFFSKSKERPIRPFKSPRSVKTNFIDELTKSDEISSQKKTKENELRSRGNSKNKHFREIFYPMENNLSMEEEPDKDESDLKRLKRLKDKSEKNELSPILKSDSTILISNSSRLSNENLRNSLNGGRNIQTKDKNVISEFRRDDQKTLSEKPIMNIIDELTKLEEDYKNFRRSSIMRAEERNDRMRDKTRLKDEGTNSEDGKYFDQRLNINNVEKFRPIGSLKNDLFAKNYDGENSISASRSTRKLPSLIDEIYDRSSTLSIDVELSFISRKKPSIRPVNLSPTSNICSKEILHQPATAMFRTFSQFSKPAMSWQKLATDRIHPSNEKNNIFSKTSNDRDRNFDSKKITKNSNEKFDKDVADLLASAVTSDEVKLLPDNLQTINNGSSIKEIHESTIFENFITTVSKKEVETTINTEPTTTMNLGEKKDFTTSPDGISNQMENFNESSSNFSTGNHKRNGAIVLSGSLKNQLGNWLTYDESNKYESRDERENSKKNYDENIEVGSRNVDEKKHERYVDQTNSTINYRRPMEIYLGTNYAHDSSTGIDNNKMFSKTNENDEKSLQNALIEHANPEKVNFISQEKSKRLNLQRSYRSIADDDRFFIQDSERQKNIDNRIEHKFEEISNVLKEAGDGQKIIREKPKSDETFEKDDSTMEKFGLIFGKIPKEITNVNDFKSHQSLSKVKPGIIRNGRNRYRLRKINDGPKIGRNSHGNSTPPAMKETQVTASKVNLEMDRTEVPQTLKRTEDFIEPISEMPETTEHKIIIDRFRLINEFKDVSKNSEKTVPESLPTEISNVPQKIRDLMEKDTPSTTEFTTIIKNEPHSEPISEIAQTTEYPTDVNKFKIIHELRDVPNSDKNIKNLSENDSTLNNSFSNIPSPILMIENLKKQLRHEAAHYSTIPKSQSAAVTANFRNDKKYWIYANEARQINTDLTPAEKVEDLITDEETLPPEEETTPLQKITNFPSSVTAHSSLDVESSNITIFPRLAIQSIPRNSMKKIHLIPSKRTNKILFLIEKSSPTSSAFFHHHKNKRNRKKRVHHHRNRRNHRKKKRLRKIKQNIVTTMISQTIVKGRAENENDEHPWYDTTIDPRLTDLNDSHETTPQVSSMVLEKSKKVVKNVKPEVTWTGKSKRNLPMLPSSKFQSFYPKSSDFISIAENEHLVDNTASKGDRNNKRGDTMDSVVNEPESLIFYDYENEDENTEGVNVDDKRSLDNAVPEEIKCGILSGGWKEKMELLKKKKHTDVLKEYLNLRQDIAPPENHGIPGYTTMISVTDERPTERNHFVTTPILNVSDETILPSTVQTYSTITETFPTTIEQQTDTSTPTTSSQQNGDRDHFVMTPILNVTDETILPSTVPTYSTITETFPTTIEQQTDTHTPTTSQQNGVEETTFLSTSESSSISMVTNSSENVQELNTTVKIEIPTGCFDNVNNINNMTDGKMIHVEENSTGRILPPCDSRTAGEQKFGDEFIAEFSKNIDHHPNRLKGISFFTSPTPISSKRGHLSETGNDLVIISVVEKNRLRNENIRGRKMNGKSSAKIYRIREEIKSDGHDRRQRSKRKKSIRTSDKNIKRQKRLPGRRLMSVLSSDDSNDNYEDDSRFDEGEEHNYSAGNENKDDMDVGNDSEKLKITWDKLIEKIIRENSSDSWRSGNTTNSWLKDIPSDHRSVLKELHFYDADKYIKKIAKKIVHTSNIYDSKDDKDSYLDGENGSRHKANSDRHNRDKSHVNLGRKLKQYPDKSSTNLRFKTADSHENGGYSLDERLIRLTRNEGFNFSSSSEKSVGARDGRDFAISLTGKIHVEGGTNGQPMSISFDTSPNIPNSSEIQRSSSNQTSRFDNQTKIAGGNPPSSNVLSNLFNISTVPKGLVNNSPRDDKNPNSIVSFRQSVRRSTDDKLRPSRENDRQKDLTRLIEKVRKSRSIDPETVGRYSKYRDDRSENLEDAQGFVGSDIDIYPEASIDEENDSEIDDDSSVPLEGRISDSGSHYINVDSQPSLDSPKFRTIKIIPVDMKKSSAFSSSLDSSQENQQNSNGDTRTNRIIGSALSNPDDEVPGTTVKSEKIEPGDTPRRENDDLNSIGSDSPEKSPESCSSQSHDENVHKSKTSEGFPMDKKMSTVNPVNLKVIGLVSMKESVMKEPNNLDVNSNSNYEMIPLIHVKIQQQLDDRPSDRNYIIPLSFSDNSQNPAGGCPKVEMTSMKNLPDSLCSRPNNIRDKIDNEDTSRNPVMPPMNMDNDEELREPIAPCPESEKTNIQNIPNCSDDRSENIRPMEETPDIPCQGNKNTPLLTNAHDSVDTTNSRKKIRMKNMLAILEFMKKINKIMSGEERTDCGNDDYNDAVIKLERIIILPNNRSDDISGRPEEQDTTTNRVVMIGEGVKHDSPCGGTSSEENFNPPENKEMNEITGNNNGGSKLNEPVTSTKSPESNVNGAENDQDQSFLFDGRNDKVESAFVKSDDVSNENQLFSNVQNNETTINSGNKEENISASDFPFQNSSNSVGLRSNDSPADNQPSGVVNPWEKDEPKEREVFHDLVRKNNNHRDLRNEDLENDKVIYPRKWKKRVYNKSMNKHKMVNNKFSSFPKIKRRRASNRLASYRTRYGLHDGRDARNNIYRSKLSPSDGQMSHLSGQKLGIIASVDGKNLREKRKKKRKKKKKKKRRRKKKKKGRSWNEAASKGKGWWPFGRQLMSLSAKRQVILDSNFDQSQVERAKTKRRGIRRIPFSLTQRKRHQRANYFHDKKKKSKKHNKNKKGRKRKKKTKKKKNKGKEEKKSGRNKRQIKPGGTQARGGQDCMDRRHPPNVNPAKYLESSHCLRFSDLWQENNNFIGKMPLYSVYELENPIMEHTIYLQLFEKHSLADGTTHWDDLTQGTMVRMGTFTRQQRDTKPTIVFTYSGAKIESQKRALNLDPSRQRLLVPSPVPPSKVAEYSEVRGSTGEYLVVQTSTISKDGNECDKAGVNFAAFTKQEDRCGRAKGSCLKNQPLAYWRHDREARDSGRRGCYFLSNFASVPTNPIKYNVSGTGSREYLGLEYHSSHVSAIDIEVRTDYNAIVRVGSSGRVTEVYIDSTSLEHTVVTVVISNMGLASSPYQPRITDCPTGLPVSWTKAKGIMQVIPPQHDQRVTLDLYGQLLVNGFHCSVEVVNHRGELVAMRRIRVQKMDRCFCVWHCLCACIGSVTGLGCQPMSPEHYHAAGFQGPVPVISTETSILMNAVKDVLMLSAFLVLLLLILGLLKWLTGMCAPGVGRWGLDSLLEGSKMEKYFERELRCRCVVTDDAGNPVHPDTGQRTVRLCSRKLEFILNLIFFLTYPIAMCCSYFKRSLQSSRQHRCCPDESKMCLINEKSSCPKMICVSTYGDSRNSRLEAEDTRYVMNELKKSQESLENPKGTKKKDGNRSDKTLVKKSSHKKKSSLDISAKRLVDDLLKKRMVFRNLNEPIGGLVVPAGTTYSLRGYFLNAENGGYRFITPCPFKQHWLIENNQKKSSKPPEIYPSNLFMCSFRTAREVYESNEMSLTPKGICINVQYLEDG